MSRRVGLEQPARHVTASTLPPAAGRSFACAWRVIASNRLHWGCGSNARPGWINSDRRAAAGVDLCGDIRDGLALADRSIDYAVAIHALQDLPWADIPRALAELRRVLKPGGVLRLALPDMDRAIAAYQRGDPAYFVVPDEHAVTIGAKLVAQLIWYGSTRTPMNWDYAREVLEAAGFRDVRRCAFRQTHSRYADIVSFDDRERETLFIEALA